jgi:DNA primase
MISQATIQQILGRIDILDVVGEFVKLKKRGSNYLGLCPFHNEKSPSFTVSPAKEIYKCFGCGKSGNSISFVMEHEKYSYVEALKWLAKKYNIEVEETFASDEQRQQLQVADSLYIINGFAQQFFSRMLFESEEGRDVGLAYFKERGFREDIIKKFQLGYSPEQRDAFTREAIAKQYNAELLVRSGLVANRNEQLVDNYRGRVIFPVHNHSGKVLGFGARILKTNDKAPKYINTPENEIYIKSKILYGSYFARQAIDKADECLLVEGYTDVLSLHQAGIENVVASGGTSLTPDQLRLVKKYTNNLTIIYDGDAAGVKAALRGLDLALEESLNVKLVLIPDKEDPDSYVNKVGPTAFRQFIEQNKKDFILFQLEVALKDAGNDSTKKAEVVNRMAETISRINKAEDFTRQQDYIQQCAQILKIDEMGLHSLVNKFIRDRISTMERKLPFEEAKLHEENARQAEDTNYDDATFNLLFKDELQERHLIKVLVELGVQPYDDKMSVADFFVAEISDELGDTDNFLSLIQNPVIRKVLVEYVDLHKKGLQPDSKSFIYHTDREIGSVVVSILNFPYEESKRFKSEKFAGGRGYQHKLFQLEWEQFKAIATVNKDTELPNYSKSETKVDDFQIESALTYLRLKKVKQMLIENQVDMEKPHTDDEFMMLQQTHDHLKQLEKELMKKSGTVIIK